MCESEYRHLWDGTEEGDLREGRCFISLLGYRVAKGLEPQILFGSRNVELKVLTRHLKEWNEILEIGKAVTL